MSVRSQFPMINSQPLIYLDNAATTQKPQSVIDTITRYYSSENANVHRGSYQSANKATSEYEQTRELVAKFINAPAASSIVWTKGTTESINLVAYSWGENNIQANDLIVVLGSEHHANFVPWQQLAARKNAHFEVVNVLPNGDVDLTHFSQLMCKRPKLVAMQHCSNALGNIHPIEQLVSEAKNAGAITLVDGAQAVAHIKVDVQGLGCDFYAFSGHKMYAPTGIGALYINPKFDSQLTPFHYGGEMISRVSVAHTDFRPAPYKYESGTPNISGVLGLKAALEFLSTEEFSIAQRAEKALYQYLLQQLQSIEHIQILGNTNRNIGVVSFIIDGESVADIGALLDQQNVAVRCGHHCAMPLMQALNVAGTVRVSLACYNNERDINEFVSALRKSIELLAI